MIIPLDNELDKQVDQQFNLILNIYKTTYKLNKDNLTRQVIIPFTKISFFQKYCPIDMKIEEFIRKALPFFNFEQYEFGQILCNSGDIQDKMFIILNGNAIILIPQKVNTFLCTQQCDTPRNQNQKRQGRQLQLWELLLQMQSQNQLYWKEGICQFQYKSELKSGQVYGELINEKTYDETILAGTQIKCITLNRADYKMLFGRELAETRKNLDFFNCLFYDISEQQLLQFINFAQQITFQPKQLLWEKGDIPQYMFFIVDGLIQQFYYETNNDNINEQQNSINDNNNKQQKKNKITFREQSKGNLIGSTELIKKLNQRQFYCQSINLTEVFIIRNEQIPKLKISFPDIYNQILNITIKDLKFVIDRQLRISQTQQQNRNQQNIQILGQNNDNNNEFSTKYFHQKKRKNNQIRSRNISLLNIEQLVHQNSQINKSNNEQNQLNKQQNDKFIYDINNSNRMEILKRFGLNKKISCNSLNKNINKNNQINKIQENTIKQKQKQDYKWQSTPQLIVNNLISKIKQSLPTPSCPLKNLSLRQKLQSPTYDKSSTMFYSARSSRIDLDNLILLTKRDNCQEI